MAPTKQLLVGGNAIADSPFEHVSTHYLMFVFGLTRSAEGDLGPHRGWNAEAGPDDEAARIKTVELQQSNISAHVPRW